MSETLQENVVSASSDEGEPIQTAIENEDSKKADIVGNLVSFTDDVLSSEDVSPTSTTNGVEEITLLESLPTEEGIIDGYDEPKPPTVGSATPTSTPPPEEGFEEIVEKEVQHSTDKKDETLKSPLALWFVKQNFHPSVIRLIYWMEVQRTTGVFGGLLFLLLSLRCYSFIGVVTTFSMSLLIVAFLYRIGMTIVKAVQKTSAEHPFKHLLEERIELPEKATLEVANKARIYINAWVRHAQCLFLVKDTVASVKALLMFWLLSYIGGKVNLLTLCIWTVVLVFTIPKLYEERQAQIDQLCSLIKTKMCALCGKIQEKLPEKIKIYLKKEKDE